MAAAALPLVGAGPVGWAILGGVVVVVGVVAIAAAIESADRDFPETPPTTVEDCPPQPTNGSPRPPPQPEEQPPRPEPPRPPPIPPYVPRIPDWEPDGPETHPTHDEVEDAENENSDDCGAIAYAINVLIRDLKFRRWDMQRHGGGDRGHREAYYRRQQSLRRLVERARALGCRYNPEADVEINRPHTYPTPRY